MKTKYWLALSMVDGLGPIRINKLIDYFGNAYKIWKASKSELLKVSGLNSIIDDFINQRENINIDSTIKKLNEKKIKYITLPEDDYPEILKNIYDPPPVLYYKGELDFTRPGLAVVG